MGKDHGKMFAELCWRAEALLAGSPEDPRVHSTKSLPDLIHELEVHQIELEMQNAELRQAEQKLEASQKKYADLCNFVPMGLFTFDQKGTILEANLAGAGMLGMERERLVGMAFSSFCTAASADRFHLHQRRVFKSPKSDQCELALINGSKEFMAEIESIAVQDAEGQYNRCQAVLIDLTERKRAEETFRQTYDQMEAKVRERTRDMESAYESLLQSESRFRQVAENVGDVIWEVDADGLYRYASPAVERILGYRPDELTGKMHFYDLFSPDVREDLKAAAFEVFASKESFRAFPNLYIHKDGKPVYLETSGVPVLDEDGELLGYRGTDIDITERKRSEESLAEQLRFETLLANLSAEFINLPTDQVNGEIESGQRRVCECLGLDLSALWWEVEPGVLTLTHLYRETAGPPRPEPMDARDYFPWCLQQLKAGKTVIIASEKDLPPEAIRDREVWRQYGVKSTLSIPLSTGGGPMIGALSFNTVREERSWPETLIKRLQLVASIFANALVRKHVEENLREQTERLTLATEGAEVGLWSMEVETGRVGVTRITREQLHLAADGDLTEDDFLAVVHVEDREMIQQGVKEAFQFGKKIVFEFRIVIPGGEIRWIMIRGKPLFKPSGAPERLLGLAVDITERKRMEAQLQSSHQKISELNVELVRLNAQLKRENIYLKEEFQSFNRHSEIVGESPAIQKVLQQIERVAPMDTHVLIMGETGTGKELVARAIHAASRRKDRLMVIVNCAALAPSLIESELFGREKGAYTGALARQIGRFELADGGTVFLDEIGELPLDLQSKLLRVIQEGEFERLGGPARTIRVNVRIIAATNKDLAESVRKGEFRNDLFYRLCVFPISVPPLRDRAGDIRLLTWAFIEEFSRKMGKKIDSVTQKTMALLESHVWPGNIRELRNAIERAMILSRGNQLEVELPETAKSDDSSPLTMEEAERHHILDTLEKTNWRVKGPQGAATLLGLKPSSLYTKMEKLGIPTRTKKAL